MAEDEKLSRWKQRISQWKLHAAAYAPKPAGDRCGHCRAAVAVAYRLYHYVRARQHNLAQFCQHCFEQVVGKLRESAYQLVLTKHGWAADIPWVTLDDPLPPFSDGEMAFQVAISEYPKYGLRRPLFEPGTRLVYADWLEERGGVENLWAARLNKLIAYDLPGFAVKTLPVSTASNDPTVGRNWGKWQWWCGWSPLWSSLYIGPEMPPTEGTYVYCLLSLIRGRPHWLERHWMNGSIIHGSAAGLHFRDRYRLVDLGRLNELYNITLPQLGGVIDTKVKEHRRELECPAD